MSNQPDFHTNMYCRTYFNKKKVKIRLFLEMILKIHDIVNEFMSALVD